MKVNICQQPAGLGTKIRPTFVCFPVPYGMHMEWLPATSEDQVELSTVVEL
jgi:hypothetical protein